MKKEMEANWQYHFGKLSELSSPGNTRPPGVIKNLHLKHFVNKVEFFKSAVLDKYDSFDIKYTLEMLDYVMDRIDSYFEEPFNENELRILVYSLGHLYKELIVCAGEIDEGL